MALRRRGLIVGLAVLLVLVAAVVLWRPSRPRRTIPHVNAFAFAAVPVHSPDLLLELIEIRGEPEEGALNWRCLLTCREAEGCYADVRVDVHFRSNGNDHHTQFMDTIAVPTGATVRLGGVKPPVEVEAVERIEIDVERGFRPGDPPPTPEL